MPEFRIRLEFDVEVDNASHIDAAWQAAEWLSEVDDFSRLVYEVASFTDLKDGQGTQFTRVDLEEMQDINDDVDDFTTPPPALRSAQDAVDAVFGTVDENGKWVAP